MSYQKKIPGELSQQQIKRLNAISKRWDKQNRTDCPARKARVKDSMERSWESAEVLHAY